MSRTASSPCPKAMWCVSSTVTRQKKWWRHESSRSPQNGAWVVNDRYYSPQKCDTVVEFNGALDLQEQGWRLVASNHAHLEGIQVVRIDDTKVDDPDFPVYYKWNTDLVNLEGGKRRSVSSSSEPSRAFRVPLSHH